MRRRWIVPLVMLLLAGCSDSQADRPSTPPVDLATDERWIGLWLQVTEEHDEVGQATDERLAKACRQALSTVQANREYLLNVSDGVARDELARTVPSLEDFYDDCLEDPRVTKAFASRFVEVTLAMTTLGARLDELGIYSSGVTLAPHLDDDDCVVPGTPSTSSALDPARCEE